MAAQKQERVWPDLATHRRDKFGNLAEVKHYRMHIQKVEGLGDVKVFEVPPNSGNCFYERDGFFSEPAGRIVDGKIKIKEPHVAFVPEAEAAAAEDAKKTQSLEAELAALRAENAALEEKVKSQEQPKKGDRK